MQHKIYLLSFLLVLSTLSGSLMMCSSNGKQKNITQIPATNPVEALPLFAVTGYGSTLENKSYQELRQAYCAGKVYVLKSVKTSVDSVFSCGNAKTILSLNDFVPLSKENILLTDINHLSNQFKAILIDSVSFFDTPEKYKLQYAPKHVVPFAYEKKVTKFMLTGVTAITRNTGKMADKHGPDFIIEKVRDYFQDADFVHISNEVSFYPNCDYNYYEPGVYRFCSKERDFKMLLDLNTNIIELTGNHNKDFGQEGYTKTYQWYQKNGMRIFGGGLSPEQANTPLIMDLKDGKKMAFIGFNESCPVAECADRPGWAGANRYNREKARKVITALKKEQKVDLVFASVQFNEVDSYSPTASQTRISRDLADFGADFVYGSQAHQVQKVEFYKGKSIFHGLGNFLFDQIHRIGVKRGFFLKNYIYQGKVVQSIPVYTMISEGRRPEIATKEEAGAIRQIIFDDRLLYK